MQLLNGLNIIHTHFPLSKHELKDRLISIDVFRGMTIAVMIIVNSPGSWAHVYPFLLHAHWHGLQLADLVFPFFLFAIGLSMSVSLAKSDTSSISSRFWKLLKRSLLIFLVGFLLNWFPFFNKNLFEVRVFGVLQRIAMSYFFAGLWLLFLPAKKHAVVALFALFLLVFYWAVGIIFGDFSLEGNVNNVVDHWLVPVSNLHKGFGIPFDPEGILGAISGSAQILIAYCIGSRLLAQRNELHQFLKFALICGLILVAIGALWSLSYPINKPLWTGSYVLLSSGFATLLFSIFVFLTDVKKYISWTRPFRVFGMNPLFSFLLSIILVKVMIYLIKIDGTSFYSYLYKIGFQPLFGNELGSLMFSFAMVSVVYSAAYLLYRNGIVVKL